MPKIIKNILSLVFLILAYGIFFIVAKPKLAAFYYNRGCFYFENSSYDKAEEYFNRSLFIFDSEPKVYYMLGQACEERQLFEKAIEYYKKTKELDPKFIGAYKALSQIYLDKVMYKEALAELDEAKKIDLSDADIIELRKVVILEMANDYTEKGLKAFKSKDMQGAHVLVSKALEFKPDFAQGHYTLAFFDFSERKYADARLNIDNALRIDPWFILARKLSGDIYVMNMDYNLALDEYFKVLSMWPDDPGLNNDIGIILNRAQRYDEAAKYLRRALESDPANSGIRYSFASNYRDSGKFDRALEEYNKILNTGSEHPCIYNDIGDIYLKYGDTGKAESFYLKEIEVTRNMITSGSHNPAVFDGLAYALSSIRKYDEAKLVVDKALALDNDFGRAYLTLSKIYEGQERFNEALSAMDRAKVLLGDGKYIEDHIKRIKGRIGEVAYK